PDPVLRLDADGVSLREARTSHADEQDSRFGFSPEQLENALGPVFKLSAKVGLVSPHEKVDCIRHGRNSFVGATRDAQALLAVRTVC
ncbi:MAG: hypothetical protein ABF459_15240, partial [Gluconobacter cerinus]